MKQLLWKIMTWALAALGLLVLVALAVSLLDSAPADRLARLNIDVLCDIELPVDRRRWQQAPYQQQTYRLAGQPAGQGVSLHLFHQQGNRALPADCQAIQQLGREKLPTGVEASFELASCKAGVPGPGPEPAAPQRLYASVDAKFMTLRLVVAASRAELVLARKDELRAMVHGLRLDGCKGLTWPRQQ